MSQPKQPTAAIIVIGNEILSGRTPDKNINWLAMMLDERGINLIEARVIGDDHDTIVAVVKALSARCDIVFTTGGIGPTHDDITTLAVADAFGVEVSVNPEADRRLVLHYQGTGIEYNEARRKMAHIPQGAQLIDNPVSGAPGFILGNVFVLPGVPSILQAMTAGLDLPQGAKMQRISIRVNLGEGTLAQGLAKIEAAHNHITIGCYPWFKPRISDMGISDTGVSGTGAFGTVLVVSGMDKEAVGKAVKDTQALIKDLGGIET